MERKSFWGKSKPLAIALFAAALFASCDFGFDGDSFQNKAGAYFKEMTSTAAVMSYNLSEDNVLKDKNGNICFGFEEDHVVSLNLRNPQHYTFTYGTNMFISLAGNTAENPLELASAVKIEQDSSDTTLLKITYPAEFLNANPLGADISPTVTLMHPVSLAQFTPYDGLKLSSNSPPPTPAGAVAMQTSDTPSRWVVCFNLPNASVVKKYHSDIESMTIEGQTAAISVNDGVISYQGAAAISATAPAGIVANQNTGVSFKASGQPVYFSTGDEADETERYYEVKLTDNAGLSTEFKVSTRGLKLSAPKAYLADDSDYKTPFDEDGGKNYISQEDDGSSFMTIRAEAKTALVTYTDKNGAVKTVEQSEYDPSNAKMFYEVYLDQDCKHLVNSGVIKGLVGKVAVPAGTSYVRSYVQKPLYSDSETVTWFCRAVSTKFYISESGDNTANTGSRSSPYRTIQFAVDKFADGMVQGDYEADCKCQIILLDNLTVPSDFDFNANGGYLINIPAEISTAAISVEGDGGEKTVTIPGAAGTRRLFLSTVSGEAEVKDLAVSGASGDAGAPPVLVAVGAKLKLTSAKLSGFTLLLAGGESGGVITNSGTLEMDGSSVTGSVGSSSGIGAEFNVVRNRGSAKIKDSEFSGHGNVWNVIDNEGALEMTGGSITDNACARSVRNRAGTAILSGLTVQNSANIWTGAALVMDGCTVTGNSSEGLGAGVLLDGSASATLTLKGANTIYDNHSALDPAKQSNVYIPYGKSVIVSGDISGSKVGVYMPFTDATKPTLTAPVPFTSGYGYGSTNPLKPGRAFWGDNGYGVAVMESGAALGEAAFAVSSGSMYGASDYNLTFDAVDEANDPITIQYLYSQSDAKTYFYLKPNPTRTLPGSATPEELYYSYKKLYTDSARTQEASGKDEEVRWEAALFSGGMPVSDATVTVKNDGSSYRERVEISGVSLTGDYTLKIRAVYLGVGYDLSVTIRCDKSAESATNYIKGLIDAGATGSYEVAVEGSVGPDMINDGLGKLMIQLRLIEVSNLDIGIKLDLSGTSNSSPVGEYTSPYFMDCGGLEEITLPDWMEPLPPSILHRCRKLRKVTFGSNVVCIPVLAFAECESLTTVDIPATVTEIKSDAFNGCSALTSITLPASVTDIAAGAFVGCASGFAITYQGTKEQWGKVTRPDQSGSGSEADDWHDGTKDDSEDTGNVTCSGSSGSKCGFDYKPAVTVSSLSAPPTAAEYPELVISTSAEFDTLASWSESANFEGITFTLKDDVTVSDDLMIKQFKGTFDGNGHALTQNFTISETSGTSGKTIGNKTLYKNKKALFWTIENGAVIKNLTVKGSATRAGIVGQMEGGTIEDCVSEVSICDSAYNEAVMGGIASTVFGSTAVIRNCVFKGTIKKITSNTDDGCNAGGIAGTMCCDATTAIIENCLNRGTIGYDYYSSGVPEKIWNAGGIVGYAIYKGIIRNCKNMGAVCGGSAGGIVGYAMKVSIFNCNNLGSVTNYKTTDEAKRGGIVGTISTGDNSLKWPKLKSNCNVNADIRYGIVGYFECFSDSHKSWNPSDSTNFAYNYSIEYSTPSSTKLWGSASGFNWSDSDCSFDTEQMNKFSNSSSDFNSAKNKLNYWIDNKSGEADAYSRWTVGASGPELVMTDVEGM